MAKYTEFLEQTKQIYREKSEDELVYIVSTDFMDFKMVNYLYGIEKGTDLICAARDYINSIPMVVCCVHAYADHFTFIVKTKEPNDPIASFTRLANDFIDEQQKKYPLCNLRISGGILLLNEKNIMSATDNVNAIRKEAKFNGSPYVIFSDGSFMKYQSDFYDREKVINRALNGDRFIFMLQPKVNMVSGRIIGAEALARMIGEDGSVIKPQEFIENMEETGSVIKLDFMILEKVCSHMSQRIGKGLPVIPTSVNLSRLHIGNPGTAAKLHNIVEKYGVPKNLIEFELTETILLNEFQKARVLIDELNKYGYRVSIDDFGAGYAGIGIWQKLNFDVLKLDKTFLDKRYIEKNNAIVPNIIDIADRLGVEIVCEGVEEEEQLRYLRKLGCTIAQGFLFSCAVDPDEFYDTYERLGGQYNVPSYGEGEIKAAPVKNEKASDTKSGTVNRKREPGYRKIKVSDGAAILIVCLMFIIGSFFTAFTGFVKDTDEMFGESILRTLDTYIASQVEHIEDHVEDIANAIDTCLKVISLDNSQDYVDKYVDTLNENVDNIDFRFLPDYYVDHIVVSEITPCKNGSDDGYCFTVRVPVFAEGKNTGCLEAVVDTDILSNFDEIVSPYGSIIAANIVDDEGTIIEMCSDDSRLLDYRNICDAIESVCEECNENSRTTIEGLLNDGGRGSVLAGQTYDDISLYVSVADISFNDLRIVVVFKADELRMVSEHLFNRSLLCMLALVSAVLIVVAVILLMLFSIRKHSQMEKRRYMLLEEFSDLVLFEYDLKKDLMRFTPNVHSMFRAEDTVIEHFRENMLNQWIFPGDMDVMERLLSGGTTKKDSVKIRLMKPETGANKKSGEYFWVKIQFKYLYDGNRLSSVIGKIIDIDDQKIREDNLQRKAITDSLTGLLNKGTFEERVKEALDNGDQGTMVVLDIDDFKKINDTYGHQCGDSILSIIAEQFKLIFGDGTISGRIGGDEMSVYVKEKISKEKATEMLRTLQNYLDVSNTDGIAVSISAGVAYYPVDGKDFKNLYKAADEAMYNAKRSGKRRCCFYRQ